MRCCSETKCRWAEGKLTIFFFSLSYSPVPSKRLGINRVYRRHTNFSLESIEQTFNGQADFNKKVTCTISRNGDLIHRVYLRVLLPDVTLSTPTTTGNSIGFRWLNWLGHILVKSVEVEIGGQRINNLVSAEKYQAPTIACVA